MLLWIQHVFVTLLFLPILSAALEQDELILDQHDDAVKTLSNTLSINLCCFGDFNFTRAALFVLQKMSVAPFY